MKPFNPISVPPKGHPLVKRLFEEMNARQITRQQLANRSGVCVDTFKSWRIKANPLITNLEACFNSIGMELTVKEITNELD